MITVGSAAAIGWRGPRASPFSSPKRFPPSFLRAEGRFVQPVPREACWSNMLVLEMKRV